MKYNLPYNHGFSNEILEIAGLMPLVDGTPSLTDIQFEALEAGVVRGESVLVSAPTSTGKTLIGWWAIASAIASGGRAVYLVSHRALAKQKFEEAQQLFLRSILGNDSSRIVCATGDSVEDASGRKTNIPMAATILVATYEKFLGCMAVGGPPRNLTDTTFICDEVQIVGDPTRGQNVELLLTLMKRSGWRQFVGLSAVLSDADTQAIADWLDVGTIRSSSREKSLRLECRSPQATLELVVNRDAEGDIQRVGEVRSREVGQIVRELIAIPDRRPVIVFCMKVDDTYEHARAWAAQVPVTREVPEPAGLEIGTDVLRMLGRRTAFHNAELSEDERALIEEEIEQGNVDVVFATSTLAAGVNFPLGSATFVSWVRWNAETQRREVISRSEFQNMAGRVGRMGQVADDGLVVTTAENEAALGQARNLMAFHEYDDLGDGITPEDFGPLVLHLFAGKLCTNRDDAFQLVASTLSANREAERGRGNVNHWRRDLDSQIDRLITLGCLAENRGNTRVTAFGLSVARTGLKPETAIYFIENLVEYGHSLAELLPSADQNNEDDLLFILAHAAMFSPEYGTDGGRATRFIHWRVSRPNVVRNDFGRRCARLLFEKPLEANPSAANGALLVASWAAGLDRGRISELVPGVRLGTVQALARDVAWILTGISEIVSSMTSTTLADEAKPAALRGDDASVEAVRQLARALRRQAARVGSGLPSDVLWMTNLELEGPARRLSRSQILALRAEGLIRPLDLMNGNAETDRRRRIALDATENPALSNLVRNASRQWKMSEREHFKRRHLRRAALVGAEEHARALYEQRRESLETAFEEVMKFLGIEVERLDGKNKQAHPDFLVTIEDYPPIIFEVKSRESDADFVALNAVTEVLAASELIGMNRTFCVTLCSPSVEPSVPGTIEKCGRLCAVDTMDLAEAILRLREGTLTRAGFHNWLSTPGIALMDDLPYPT